MICSNPTSNLIIFRFQISCHYLKFSQSACMFCISYSFRFRQYRRYIAGIFNVKPFNLKSRIGLTSGTFTQNWRKGDNRYSLLSLSMRNVIRFSMIFIVDGLLPGLRALWYLRSAELEKNIPISPVVLTEFSNLFVPIKR